MPKYFPSILKSMTILSIGFALAWLFLEAKETPKDGLPNPVDIGFAQFMSLHHEQAIEMAKLVLSKPESSLHPLAESIAYAQIFELGEMQGWLKIWKQALQPRSQTMDWMLAGKEAPGPEFKQYLIDCEQSASGMPGLASQAEMQQLKELQGTAGDIHFLKLMLAHHAGGIPMARFAALHGNTHVIQTLAQAIAHDQTHEIEHMQKILRSSSLSAENQISVDTH